MPTQLCNLGLASDPNFAGYSCVHIGKCFVCVCALPLVFDGRPRSKRAIDVATGFLTGEAPVEGTNIFPFYPLLAFTGAFACMLTMLFAVFCFMNYS